jgi:hypothetical protein
MRISELTARAVLLGCVALAPGVSPGQEAPEVSQPVEVTRAAAPAPVPAAPPPELLELLEHLPMLDEYGDVLDAELDRLAPVPPGAPPEPQHDPGVR